MKAQNIALAIIGLLVFLPACSAMQAERELKAIQQEGIINTIAWTTARAKLHAMCAGNADCGPRLVKMGNGLETEDWEWNRLPSYQTIVNVHEEELRKARGTLRLYEEYMFALSHALAQRVDSGEITPEQFKLAFNEGWKWMGGQVRNDYSLLQQNVGIAKQADAEKWRTIGNIAIGLAAVTTAVIVADAEIRAANIRAASYAAPAYISPQPLHCLALPAGASVLINCN